MQRLFPSLMLVSPFLLLAACGDGNLDVEKKDGSGGTGAGGAGTGGVLGMGGGTPGSGGISGTGGGMPGTGGSSPGTGGISGTGGTGSGGQTGSDAGQRDSGSGSDNALDTPAPDVPLDGLVTYDVVSCQAPRVWGYQQPGCGVDAHPVCAHGVQDACLRYACGCDGEILEGCDYYRKPWRSKGFCPDTCFSPTQNLQLAIYYAQIKGCACNPAGDAPQCIQGSGLISCVGGIWTLDQSKTCPALDAGSDGPVALDAPADDAVAPGCDVGVARAAMAARGLVVTGSAETHNETLPSPISGPNWGLKSTACQDGGYDITGLAGQTVCLVKQTIVQACAQAPYLAWAVMSAGSVQCLYKTDDTTPGVYAVNGGRVCP